MTGEMCSIDQSGLDSNGEEWPIHAAIAKALGGTLQPFDVYQGPYILIGEDVRTGNPPYAVAVQHMGVKRLWIVPVDNGPFLQVYREDTETLSSEFWWDDTDGAIAAAHELMAM
jgi:hypothetical protein